MRSNVKKWVLTAVKLTIAVAGLWWVISHTPWNDQVTIRGGAVIRAVEFVEPTTVAIVEKGSEATTKPGTYNVSFGKSPVKVRVDGAEKTTPINMETVGIPNPVVVSTDRLVTVEGSPGVAKVQVGLRNLIIGADPLLLLAAWAVLVIPFLVTAWRWMKLMQPQGIRIPYRKCLALTFVGQFYSTFLPGITGGDLVKIVYTSRLTGSKGKSAVTILLDRVIGLVALMVIAGTSAGIQYAQTGNKTMGNVTLLIGAALGGLVVGAAVYFSNRARRLIGLDRLTQRAAAVQAVQEAVASDMAPANPAEVVSAATGTRWERLRSRIADEIAKLDAALHVYRGHVGVLAGAFGVSLIAQFTLPLSAYLAGRAFGISPEATLGHYLAYVPLAILAASVPIAPPQGFGVTEWILFHFFHKRGPASAGQAFALAQAVRFLPVMWNLVGAYWVVTGSYSRESAKTDARADDPSAPVTTPA